MRWTIESDKSFPRTAKTDHSQWGKRTRSVVVVAINIETRESAFACYEVDEKHDTCGWFDEDMDHELAFIPTHWQEIPYPLYSARPETEEQSCITS